MNPFLPAPWYQVLGFGGGLASAGLLLALSIRGYLRGRSPRRSIVLLALSGLLLLGGLALAVWELPRSARVLALFLFASLLGLLFLILALFTRRARCLVAGRDPQPIAKALLQTGGVLALAPWLAWAVYQLLLLEP